MWTVFIFILGAIVGMAFLIIAIAAFMRGGSAVVDPNARQR